MDSKESLRMIHLIAESLLSRALDQETCVCSSFEEPIHFAALQKLAIATFTADTPEMVLHMMMYAYQAGKKIAEEQMLALLTEEPKSDGKLSQERE